jgi:hypothetical protein
VACVERPRRAKDWDEFDCFMAERNVPSGTGSASRLIKT